MTIDPTAHQTSTSEYVNALMEEYMELARQGAAPRVAEFVQLHPEHATELNELLETVLVVNQLGPQNQQDEALTDDFPEIADYQLLRVAGRGGMGVVYEAIQESLVRRVALKVLPNPIRHDKVARERFQLEARTAAKLHHTNIVPVYEVGEHNGHCFYSMQYIEGDTLDAVVKKLREIRHLTQRDQRTRPAPLSSNMPVSGTAGRAHSIALSLDVSELTVDDASPEMPVSETAQAMVDTQPVAVDQSNTLASGSDTRPFFRNVAHIGCQAAVALHYAHTQGIVHRDIKPSNLILDVSGHVWITDFGLAKLSDADDLTRAGDVVGTLRYMSPERFAGKCDGRSDIYSLGVTLYELVALQAPFLATDRIQLIEQIKEGGAPKLRALNRRVPYDLQMIIAKSMELEPRHRYQSAQEMSQDLQRFMAGEPVHARRVSSLERLWLWSRKNVGLAASLAAVLLLLLTGAIGSAAAALVFQAQSIAQAKIALEKVIESEKAKQQRDVAWQNAYFADIRQAQQDWENGQALRMLQTLRRYVPSETKEDVRGWEWFYLLDLARQGPKKSLLDQAGSILQVRPTRDGQQLLSSASDGSLAIRRAEGDILQTINIPGLLRFVISPDDSQIATISDDGFLRIWERDAAQLMKVISLPSTLCCDLDWSPDNQRVVVAFQEDSGPVFVDLHSEEMTTLARVSNKQNKQRLVSFSPNGKYLAVVCVPGVFIWDCILESWLDTSSLPIFPTSFTWHPDSLTCVVAASLSSGMFRVNPNTSVVERSKRLEEIGAATSLNFSLDGKQLVVGSEGMLVEVYDVGQPQQSTAPVVHTGHLGVITTVAVHPDGQGVISGGVDGAIKFWDLWEVSPPPTHIDTAPPTLSVSTGFSPDGKWMWSRRSGKLYITDRESDAVVCEMVGVGNAIDFITEFEWMLVLSPDQAWVFDTKTWQPVPRLSQASYASSRRRASIEYRNRVLASYDNKGLIKIVDLKTGRDIKLLANVRHDVAKLALSHDGTHLVTASEGRITLFDTASGDEIADFFGHDPGVDFTAIVWAHDDRHFATASTDKSTRIWDSQRQTPVRVLRGHQSAPQVLQFSSDDSRLLSRADMTKIWHVQSEREIISFSEGATAPSSSEFLRLPAGSGFEALEKALAVLEKRSQNKGFQLEQLILLAELLVNHPHSPEFDPMRGLKAAQAALQGDPTNPDFMLIAAKANYRNQEFVEALRLLKLAEASAPESSCIRDVLVAVCLAKLGKMKQARKRFATALSVHEETTLGTERAAASQQLATWIHEASVDLLPAPTSLRANVVTTLEDELDGDINGQVSLREALLWAQPGDRIEFAVAGVSNLKYGSLIVDKAVEIIGPGPTQLVLKPSRFASGLLRVDDGDPTRKVTVLVEGIGFENGSMQKVRLGEPRVQGGAIYNAEALSLVRCNLSNNSAADGGAIYTNSTSQLVIRQCNFVGNRADQSGGAIHVDANYSGDFGIAHVHESFFSENTSSFAGSSIASHGKLSVTNSTFHYNGKEEVRLSQSSNGSVLRGGAETTIDFCTFTDNFGLDIDLRSRLPVIQAKRFTLRNSVVSDLAVGHDAVLTISNSILADVQGEYADGGNNMIGIDPKLDKLADNGGPTATRALLEGSPAIDAGSQTQIEFDQRGESYRRTVNGRPDIGAFEFQADAEPN